MRRRALGEFQNFEIKFIDRAKSLPCPNFEIKFIDRPKTLPCLIS